MLRAFLEPFCAPVRGVGDSYSTPVVKKSKVETQQYQHVASVGGGAPFALQRDMKHSLRWILGLLMAGSLQACGVKAPTPETACHFQQNSYQQRVSWSWKTPVVMYSNESLSDEQADALEKAIVIWNETVIAQGFKRGAFFKYGGKITAPSGFRKDGKNVVSMVNGWPGKGTEQAETEINWANDRIFEADMRINATKPLSTSDTGEPGKFDLVALFVHELGHVLGLLHIDTTDYTSMSATLGANNVERRNIGEMEIEALKCEY
jgi:hypothetical protein